MRVITAKDLFAGDELAGRTFRALMDKVRSIYPDTDFEVVRELVVFSTIDRPFLWVWAPARGNTTYGDCPLVISFGLCYKVPPCRYTRIVQSSDDRWIYHIGIPGPDGICDTLLTMISKAYEDKSEDCD